MFSFLLASISSIIEIFPGPYVCLDFLMYAWLSSKLIEVIALPAWSVVNLFSPKLSDDFIASIILNLSDSEISKSNFW